MWSITKCQPILSRTAQLQAQRSLYQPQSRLLHIIEGCPKPTCACARTPENLDIERESSMLNAIPSYNQHVMFLTGNADWPSKIEGVPGQSSKGNVVSALKKYLREDRLGNPNPDSRPLISYTSLIPPKSTTLLRDPGINNLKELSSRRHIRHEGQVVHAYNHRRLNGTDHVLFTFPTFRYFHVRLSAEHEQDEQQLHVSKRRSQSKTELLILICGHMSRDRRCGILGPLLEKAFKEALERKGISVSSTPKIVVGGPQLKDLASGRRQTAANVGLISHIGGHKWAGNVIIYTPPSFRVQHNTPDVRHPLRGTGIWYGRVEPKHVEGIVDETILKGNVIKELLRGGVDSKGDTITF